MSITERLNAAKTKARNGGLPFRRSDGALYDLLSDLLSIIEEVERDSLQDELRAAVKVSVDHRNPEIWGNGRAKSNNGKGRRFAEKNTDASILVCRYAFDGYENRNSTYRYALSLREARRRQIRSADLTEWLHNNGGVNTLYLTRPTETKSHFVRTIHLNQAVEAPVDGTITITLCRDHRGFFDVVQP